MEQHPVLCDLPVEMQLFVCDRLHVFDRFRLSRTCRHFSAIIPTPQLVEWIVDQRCRPCGSLFEVHQCHSGWCYVSDSWIIKKRTLTPRGDFAYFREMKYSVRLFYSEEWNSFVFHTAEKLNSHCIFNTSLFYESDLFAITDSGAVACWVQTIVCQCHILHHIAFVTVNK
jgi:hypothetical protein